MCDKPYTVTQSKITVIYTLHNQHFPGTGRNPQTILLGLYEENTASLSKCLDFTTIEFF